MAQSTHDNIRKAVREQYSKVAKSDDNGCCTSVPSCCDESDSDAKRASMALGYSTKEVGAVPEGANMGLGCGNPQAIASLSKGETVLDLGCGGGFDCFLAAKEVGESGHVIGVDMTPDMVSKARSNAERTDHENVEFRLGEIEHLPVADGTVDVIISNCVINLSPEKAKVFQDTFRVLKPGGRLAISDVVATAELPEEVRSDMALYTGCIAGASPVIDIEKMLKEAGFEEVKIELQDKSREFIRDWHPGGNIEDFIVSATIEAIKPKV
jgi:SAM-dependent methyltransferase